MNLRKIFALLLVLVLVFGTMPNVSAEGVKGKPEIMKKIGPELSLELRMQKVLKAAKDSKAESEGGKTSNIRLAIQNDGSNITSKLVKAGARVVERIADELYSVTIPASKAMGIINIPGIKNVALDKTYKLDPREREGFDGTTKLETDSPNVGTTLDDTKVDQFEGSTGEGVKIAVIDTGVEPDHEFLRDTIQGKIKIIDWQDFTTEGNVIATEKTAVTEEEPAVAPAGDKGDTTVVEAVYADQGEAASETVNVGDDTTPMQNSGEETYIGKIGDTNFIFPAEFSGKTVYHGNFYEGIFPNEILFGYEEGAKTGKDMNFDGDKEDNFPVVAADFDDDGKYDHAVVDTDLDNDFSDETILGVYKNTVDKEKSHAEQANLIAHFPDKPGGRAGQHVNFVLTKLAEKDGVLTINIGFDGGSHGTHVSGIASGYNADQKDDVVDRGVAPGANIMALKVLGTNVGGAMTHIINAMIYAAQNGADIVNMSLGSTPDINDGSNLEAQYADFLSETYGTVFAISAGNNGTGINSIGAPGDATGVISSGAYIDSETWSEYGANNPDTYGLWYFSSIGPREDGAVKPTIISPGSAISSVPAWEDLADPANPDLPENSDLERPSFPYHLYQGTSMASPHTAGIMALLLQKAREDGLATGYAYPYGDKESDRVNPALMRKAVRYTGDKTNLEDYKFAEIGGGLIDVVAAYDYIKDKIDTAFNRALYALAPNEKLPYGSGIYVRNTEVPESVDVVIENYDTEEVQLDLTKYAGGDWFDFNDTTITVPAGVEGDEEVTPGTTTITVTLNQQLEPGFYSDAIMCDDGDGVIDLEIPVTLAVSDLYRSEDAGSKTYEGTVPSSKYNRHFVQIPNGTLKFTVTLTVATNGEGTPLGKMRVLGFNPDGMEIPDFFEVNDDYAGLGSDHSGNTVSYTLNNPMPGNWEFDAYARWDQATLQQENGIEIQDAPYVMNVDVECVVPNPDKWEAKALPGTVLNQQFKFTNAMNEEINPEVTGTSLVDLDQEPVTQQLEFASSDNYYMEEVTIEDDDPNYVFEVSIMDTHDFDLYLYDEDFNTVAQCADSDGDESISLKSLAAGTYYIYIENYEGADTTLTYKKRILNSSNGLPDSQISINGPGKAIADGETWTADAQMTVPAVKDHNFMALIMVKDDGKNVGKVPVYLTSSEGTAGDLVMSEYTVTPDKISYNRPAAINAFANKFVSWKVDILNSFGTNVKTFTAENTSKFTAEWAPGQFDGSGKYKAVFSITDLDGNKLTKECEFNVYNYPIDITDSRTYGENNNEKTAFGKGEQVRARVQVKNLGPAVEDATLIVQVLDPKGDVIRLEFLEIEDMAAGQGSALGISFKLANNATAGTYTVKSFLWDAYSTMKPQSGVNETTFTVK